MIPTPDQLQQVSQFIQQELKRHRLTGAYAVVAGGEVVLEGASSPGNPGAHITADTPFEIGSITKSMTATAILQLRDQGLLDLGAPVQQYLPWFGLAASSDFPPITIRHLLTHSSGISGSAQGMAVAQDYDRVWPSVEAGVRALQKIKPASAPGDKFAYSNMGYAVLGMVVEAVSGRPWAQYIQDEIMAPLGMTRSMADYTSGSLPIAPPRRWTFGLPAPVRHRMLGPYLAPAGSTTACSVQDLARYLAAHMGYAPMPCVSPESLAEAHRGAVSMGDRLSYGFGWVEQTTKEGDKVIWHNGGTESATSLAIFSPALGVGVVVLVSRMTLLTDKLGFSMLAILRGKEAKPLKARFDPGRVVSLAMSGLTLLGIWMLLQLVRNLTSGTLTGYGGILGYGVPAVLFWLIAARAPTLIGAPLHKFTRWPIDVALGIGLMLAATSLSTIYAIYSSFVLR